MASGSHSKIDPFDPKKIKLEVWLSMLQAHFGHYGINDDTKKKNSLLISLGTETFSVLASLCAPSLPHDDTLKYDDIVSLLKTHFIVKPSYHRSLIKFQQRKKNRNESLRDLYADLKALASDCNFGIAFDGRVRDQLFMAIDSEVYFPNLAAENLDLQTMTSVQTLERVLSFEKAFCSEKVSLSDSVNALKLNSGVSSRKANFSCRHCGYPHRSEDCRFSHLTCSLCNKKGHLKRVCSRSRPAEQIQGQKVLQKQSVIKNSDANGSFYKSQKRKGYKKKVNAVAECDNPDFSDDSDQLLNLKDDSDNSGCVFSLENCGNDVEPIRTKITLRLNNADIPYEVDSGAVVSTLNRAYVQSLGLTVHSSRKGLKAYGNNVIHVIGKVDVNVKFNDYNISHVFYVVDDFNVNLCGKDLMPKLGISLTGLEKEVDLNVVLDAKSQLEQFSIDPKLPVNNVVAKIHLKDGALPKFHKSRPVASKYVKLVEEALDKLVEDDIIESVKFSDWAAPIVPVLKSDKQSMRICGDFKYLNDNIACEKYPLPRLEEIFAVVGKSNIFSKIDLKDAYLQLPVDVESQKLLVINTPKGLFKYKRLPFGVSSSTAIFQRFISQVLMHIDGVIAFLDDIFIGGETQEEHDERLNRVLRELQKHNVAINKNKTVLNTSNLEYLGYVISGDGIRPSPKKVAAILEAPSPSSVGEVKSFLGMVTYYSRFVPNFSSVLSPLYDLLKKNAKFRWSDTEASAFNAVKAELSESNFLANFDGNSQVLVEVDASPVGVGCVLMQKFNGIEKPVYFASKKLSAAELKYSQLDKEALALVYAVSKFKYFLLGRKFVIRTDHKPLLGLFGRTKLVPVNANARVQRWALLLSQFDYDLCFKAGKDNVVADALSRLPLSDSDLDSTTPIEYVHMVQALDDKDVSFESIKSLSKSDPVLKKVINGVRYGWVNDPLISEFAKVKDDLSIYDDVLLFRNRVVIPADMRSVVLDQLHVGHNGISAMKSEARNWVWWPKLDQDINEVTKSCNVCFKNYQPTKSNVLSWPETGKPWERVHIDYAGPIDGDYFLIIIDSFTKFLDIHVTKSTTSSITIEKLRHSFCNFGLPNVLVSDNAKYFVSDEMETFLRKNDIKHATPAPYNPSSNGLAERAVKTFKEGLGKFTEGNVKTRLCRFLYNYRRTVHSSTGKSPSDMMFNRNFRGLIEKIKPQNKKGRELKNDCKFEKSKYEVDDAVFVKNFGAGKTWMEGKIIEVLGIRNYKVQLKNFGNMVWKRHADQLMPRFTPNSDDCILPYSNSTNNQLPEFVWPSDPAVKNSDTGSHCDKNNSCTDLEISVEPAIADQSIPEPVSLSEPVPLRRSGRVVKPPDRMNL